MMQPGSRSGNDEKPVRRAENDEKSPLSPLKNAEQGRPAGAKMTRKAGE
jgi:hypothetical protein